MALTRLLTVRRIAELTTLPVSVVRRVLDENPQIQPVAMADFRPIYDKKGLQLFAQVLLQAKEKYS